jgi:RNA polymerase sigma-70 factor, ECF subfamily
MRTDQSLCWCAPIWCGLADVLQEDPDLDLLPAAVGGDLDAFEALVRRYQQRIVTFVRAFTSRDADAEDLAQEVFVRVYKALGRFRGESSFRTWLYKVALNVGRTHGDRRRREDQVWADSGADETTTFDPPDTADFETAWLTRDTVARALEMLPEELRVAVTLRDIHGLEYRDIAQTIGAPIGTVESRIFRARQRLRTSLEALRAR